MTMTTAATVAGPMWMPGTVVGTTACAGAGALAGRLIFGKSAAAQLIPALVAGAFCFSVLSKRDNAALRQRSEELMNQQGPSSTSWVAPESGKQVTISTGEERIEQQNVKFQYNQDVAKPPANTQVEASTYEVVADRLNFRSAPNKDDPNNIIGYFNRDANVEVIGYTPDGRWALVGDNGVVVGYAAIVDGNSQLLVTPEVAAQMREDRANEAAKTRNAKQRKAAQEAARAAEAARDKARARPIAANGDVLPSKRVITTQVVASTTCKSQVARTGDQSLSRNGCKTTDGTFRFT